MEESEYRKWVQETFNRIERAFVSVDPDVLECEVSSGVLTLRPAKKGPCILSGQPSLRQIWVAVASEGRAYHFSFDPVSRRWLEDKNGELELLSFVAEYAKKTSNLDIQL